MALKSGIQTYQILTNDDEVCIPSLSSIPTISQVFMPTWWWNFKNKEWGFLDRFLRNKLAILRCWSLKTHPGISIFCISLIPIHQVDMKTSVKIMIRMFMLFLDSTNLHTEIWEHLVFCLNNFPMAAMTDFLYLSFRFSIWCPLALSYGG